MKPNTKNTKLKPRFSSSMHTTNPEINIHHKPRSTKLTTYKPTVRIHISTTICTTELRDREMKEKDLPIWDRETMIYELERV